MQVLRGFGIALDLAAKAADVDREEVAGKLGIVAPNGFKELVSMERAAAVAGEGVEEFELPLRKGQRAAIDTDHTTGRVHLKAADLNRRAFGGIGIIERAAKLRPHAGQQLPRIEWL